MMIYNFIILLIYKICEVILNRFVFLFEIFLCYFVNVCIIIVKKLLVIYRFLKKKLISFIN